jgi:hypothetical protein
MAGFGNRATKLWVPRYSEFVEWLGKYQLLKKYLDNALLDCDILQFGR